MGGHGSRRKRGPPQYDSSGEARRFGRGPRECGGDPGGIADRSSTPSPRTGALDPPLSQGPEAPPETLRRRGLPGADRPRYDPRPRSSHAPGAPALNDDIPTLRRILAENRVVAMVGLSASWYRPSYFAAKYLLDHGYRVIPVKPHYPVPARAGDASRAHGPPLRQRLWGRPLPRSASPGGLGQLSGPRIEPLPRPGAEVPAQGRELDPHLRHPRGAGRGRGVHRGVAVHEPPRPTPGTPRPWSSIPARRPTASSPTRSRSQPE